MGGGAAAGGKDSGFNPMFIALPLIVLVLYFFNIRPQRKKAASTAKFKEQIGLGDKVVTIGGIHGTITKVNDKTFMIETGNTTLEVLKSAISIEYTKAVSAEVPIKA